MTNLNNVIEIKISENDVKYFDAINFMQKRVEDLLNNKEKELIWFLNHDHIYTCGTSYSKSEMLNITKVPIVESNRGGKITYHGPGQRIVYLIIDLNKRKKDIKKFISLLENTVIELLKVFEIESASHKNKVGIWITKVKKNKLLEEKKIGAIGLRIKKWITYHGISFNINPELSYYKNIKPCGLDNRLVTSLDECGIKITQKEFDKMFIDIFLKKLKTF
tara:strand:- start:2183 stop:2842 length:660 start_codon:yes stop_codon:yes gene_type:complete